MSENLVPFSPNGGAIERFGMSAAIGDQLDRNFIERGINMAQLLVATLTETPYTPLFEGVRYEIPVSNKYSDDSPDTVDEARDALAEALKARASGMNRARLLKTFQTDYRSIAKKFLPDRGDGERNRKAFEGSFVGTVRQLEVPLPDPVTGYKIIKNAPKSLCGLRLRTLRPRLGMEQAELVTTAGRLVTFESRNSFGLLATDVWTEYLPENPRERGGRAPRPMIATTIRERVVKLRTKKSER